MKPCWASTLALALTLALMIGCGAGEQAPSTTEGAAGAEPTDVRFALSGAPGDSAIRIIGIVGNSNYLVDSLPLVDGAIHLKRDTALPSGLYFLDLPGSATLQFILDQDQSFSITTDISAPITAAKVEGSLDNTLLYQNLQWELSFQARLNPIQASLDGLPLGDTNRIFFERQLQSLDAERRDHFATYQQKHPESFFTQYKVAEQNPELRDIRLPDGRLDEEARLFHYRNEFWDNTPLDDPRLLRTPVIAGKLEAYLTQATPQVHDSITKYLDLLVARTRKTPQVFQFIVNWAAIYYHNPKGMGLESVFVHIVDRYFTDHDAFWASAGKLRDIRKEAAEMRPSLVGKVGQNLICKNLQGKEEALYDLHAKATVLFMWNYECEHCREEAPKLRDLLLRHRARGMEVYALCMGNDEAEWKGFVQEAGLQAFHNVWDPTYQSRYYAKYHVDVTPELYVLDEAHQIVCKDVMPDYLGPVLATLLD